MIFFLHCICNEEVRFYLIYTTCLRKLVDNNKNVGIQLSAHEICFWNNLHRVPSKSNNLNIFGIKKAKQHKHTNRLWSPMPEGVNVIITYAWGGERYHHLCLRGWTLWSPMPEGVNVMITYAWGVNVMITYAWGGELQFQDS